MAREFFRPAVGESEAVAAETVRFVVRFEGRVQGVGFRATTVQSATGLDVHGHVRNQPDGSVELDVDGSTKSLEELVERVRRELSGNIEHVEIDRRAPLGRDRGLTIAY